jgi:integration host factor subunit alpha
MLAVLMMILELEQERVLVLEQALEQELALEPIRSKLSVGKKDLVSNISIKLRTTQIQASHIVNSFFSFLEQNHTKNINIHKFGSFSYKKTPKRVGRNPKTLQEFNISARKKIVFKASEEVKRNFN